MACGGLILFLSFTYSYFSSAGEVFNLIQELQHKHKEHTNEANSIFYFPLSVRHFTH